MEIKTVALIGAGAVGAYFIWGMAERLGDNFCVVAAGDRAKRLREDGVLINDTVYRPRILDLSAAMEDGICKTGADLVLVCTKYDGLPTALDSIRAVTGEKSIVMSLLNGIDSEEIISSVIPKEQILYSVMAISSRRVGQRITFDPAATPGVTFGETASPDVSERMRAVADLFDSCGIRYQFSRDIIGRMWTKFTQNIAYNLPQAVLGVGYGAYSDSAHVSWLADQLEREVRAVAEQYGITLQMKLGERWVGGASARYSTLQDIDAGRHTEVEMFLGVLMNRARSVQVETPVSAVIYHMIKAMEEKNDGKFAY